jgi:hypothetical protein
MKEHMLEYTREEISRLPDDRLDRAWKEFMTFAGQRQRLREEVQRMLRRKSRAKSVRVKDIAFAVMYPLRRQVTRLNSFFFRLQDASNGIPITSASSFPVRCSSTILVTPRSPGALHDSTLMNG